MTIDGIPFRVGAPVSKPASSRHCASLPIRKSALRLQAGVSEIHFSNRYSDWMKRMRYEMKNGIQTRPSAVALENYLAAQPRNRKISALPGL